MNRFNSYMNSHFGSCRLLAYAHDNCRNREVKIHMIPGHTDVVGITDGTDAWVAPVVKGSMYFHRVDVWQMLADLQDGKELPKPIPPSARRRVSLADEQPQEAPATRRRAVIEEQQEQTPRRRNVEI